MTPGQCERLEQGPRVANRRWSCWIHLMPIWRQHTRRHTHNHAPQRGSGLGEGHMRGRGALSPPTVRCGGSSAGTPPSFSKQAARRLMQVFLFNMASPPPHAGTHIHAHTQGLQTDFRTKGVEPQERLECEVRSRRGNVRTESRIIFSEGRWAIQYTVIVD